MLSYFLLKHGLWILSFAYFFVFFFIKFSLKFMYNANRTSPEGRKEPAPF